MEQSAKSTQHKVKSSSFLYLMKATFADSTDEQWKEKESLVDCDQAGFKWDDVRRRVALQET